MKKAYGRILNCRPDSEQEISELAEKILINADVLGMLPTPIDELVKENNLIEVVNLKDLNKKFISSLKKDVGSAFRNMMQKIRGIADLRERVNYIPQDDNPIRSTFPRAHELAHQVIPWHKIDPKYLDDNKSLSPDAEYIFDQEANLFASEVIFQGKSFRKHVLDYTASFDAVFKLSDIYGASKQATLWRYIEEQDETIAVAQYYPIDVYDDYGNKIFNLWNIIPSAKFRKKYHKIELPKQLRTGHPWTAARDMDRCEGKEKFICDNDRYLFEWQAWWNCYTLFVLLRRKPRLSLIKH